MKKLIIFSFLVAAFIVSCNEKDIIDNAKQVGDSKITYYPILTLKGNLYETVVKGTSFTDPGATAVAGGADVPVVTSGTVNTNTVGVYVVTYTATNTDGFSASASRFVVVYSTDAGAAANDFSGTYKRTSNGVLAIWTKLAPGVYQVLDPAGVAGDVRKVVAFNPTGLIINVPPQPDSGGSTTSCTNSTGGADITYILGPPGKYAWVVINPSFYLNNVRTFIKQ